VAQDVVVLNGYGSISPNFSQAFYYGTVIIMISSSEPPEKQNQKPRAGLAGAAWQVSAAIMISRILGVGREVVLARYFGAGFFTDAFYVAYRIPNLLRDLFAEGALSAAFLPTFVRRLTQDGKQQAWLLANRVLSALLVILGILTLVFFFGAKGFVYLLAAGYAADPEKFELTAQMTRIMSPFLLCVSFASVGMGLLNACGSFFVPALASSAFNICCILAGIFLSPFMPHLGLDPVVSMAIGALVGGASQFLVMVPSAYGYGFRFRFALDFKDPGLRHIAKLMLPSIVGLSATQINITVDLQIASTYGDGPVSWLSYAFRLVHLPVGVFGIAIATATMAAVAHHAAQNEHAELHQTVESSLRLAACLTFPAMLGLIVFRNEIVQLLYERGSFLPTDTLKTGQALWLYALGIFAYAAVKILVPALYALNDARTPARLSLLTVAVKIALNFLFILPLGFLGLALSTAISSWLNCCFLVRRVYRHRGMQWSIRNLEVYLRIALASTVMILLAWLVYQASGLMLSGSGFFVLAARLSLAIGFSLISLLPLLRFFRIEEASVLVHMIGNLVRKVL
jgi:putative peptidoglycan lipid II flippase